MRTNIKFKNLKTRLLFTIRYDYNTDVIKYSSKK